MADKAIKRSEESKALEEKILKKFHYLTIAIPNSRVSGFFVSGDKAGGDTAYYDLRSKRIVFSRDLVDNIADNTREEKLRDNLTRTVIIHESLHSAQTLFWPKITCPISGMLINHLEDWRLNQMGCRQFPYFKQSAEVLSGILAKSRTPGPAKKQHLGPVDEFVDMIGGLWTNALSPEMFEYDLDKALRSLKHPDAVEVGKNARKFLLGAYRAQPNNLSDPFVASAASRVAIENYWGLLNVVDELTQRKLVEKIMETAKKLGVAPQDLAKKIRDKIGKGDQQGGKQGSQQGQQQGGQQGGQPGGQQGGQPGGQQGGQPGGQQGGQPGGQQGGQPGGQQGGQPGGQQGGQPGGQQGGQPGGQQGGQPGGQQGGQPGGQHGNSKASGGGKGEDLDSLIDQLRDDTKKQLADQLENPQPGQGGGEGNGPGDPQLVDEDGNLVGPNGGAGGKTGKGGKSAGRIHGTPRIAEDSETEKVDHSEAMAYINDHSLMHRELAREMANAMGGEMQDGPKIRLPSESRGRINTSALVERLTDSDATQPLYVSRKPGHKVQGKKIFKADMVISVIDGSGSMSGGPIESAKAIVSSIMAACTMNKIPFLSAINYDSVSHILAEGKADMPSRIEAQRKVLGIKTEGGTDMAGGAILAMTEKASSVAKIKDTDAGRIIFVTDGYIYGPESIGTALGCISALSMPTLVLIARDGSYAEAAKDQRVSWINEAVREAAEAGGACGATMFFDPRDRESMGFSFSAFCKWMSDPKSVAKAADGLIDPVAIGRPLNLPIQNFEHLREGRKRGGY